MQSILKNDPLLDGSTATILIDNDLHPEQVSFSGKWTKTRGNWAAKANGTHLLLNMNPRMGDKVEFLPDILSSELYSLYVYSPILNGYISSSDMKPARMAKCSIENNQFTEDITFNTTTDNSDWIKIGEFRLTKNSFTKIIITATEKGVLGVDAILLVQ